MAELPAPETRPGTGLKAISLVKVRRITAGETDHDHPVFSPDGRRIAFAAGPYGRRDLYLVDRRGRFGRRLTDGPGDRTQPCFAPDGATVAYCEARPGSGAFELRALDLAPDATPRPLLAREGVSFKQPAFSPDGRLLAYFSDDGSPGNFHLFVLDLATSEVRQVTDARERNDCHPAWSPDGRSLAFHGYEGLAADRANIYTLELATGALARLTRSPGLSKHPCYASSRAIVFHRDEPGQGASLFLAEVAGRAREVRLTRTGLSAKQPSVARTRRGGLRVVFTGVRGASRLGVERTDLYVASLRGVAPDDPT